MNMQCIACYGGGDAFEMVQIEEGKRGFGRISCEKTEMSKRRNGMGIEWKKMKSRKREEHKQKKMLKSREGDGEGFMWREIVLPPATPSGGMCFCAIIGAEEWISI
jgi:hypothetical protein